MGLWLSLQLFWRGLEELWNLKGGIHPPQMMHLAFTQKGVLIDKYTKKFVIQATFIDWIIHL